MVTNVLGLAAAILGDKYYWWIDPVGAIILAIYTITNWSGTVWENAGTPLLTIIIIQWYNSCESSIILCKQLISLDYLQ